MHINGDSRKDIFRNSHIIGYSVGGSTSLILGTASIWSKGLRCSLILILPGLFSGRGRAFLMTLATGLLIDGSVGSINYNLEEIIR